ncbi:unnamed protein product [Peniophora sp. CBMAI 1063]|nr:unnamed protein product [Peniophora sp. CBMAI 1063]
MPRKARVNHNLHYTGPHPPAFPDAPMKPQWTYRTKGTMIFPDLKCDTCGGVLPGGRRLSTLFTRRCRCDDGVDDAASAVAPSYVQTADPGVYYTWDPRPVQVVELFRPNPLPELPESFKRIRAADQRAAKRRSAGRGHRERHASRSPSRSRRHNPSPGPASDEPAITFYVEDARHRLQHVSNATAASEPLHPFLDTLLDALDELASDQPRPRLRTKKTATATSRSSRLPAVNEPIQSAAVGLVSPTTVYPSPPPSPPPPPMTPAQPSASYVPSPRVPPSSPRRYPNTPRYPIAEPRSSPGSPSIEPPAGAAPVFTPRQPAHRDTTRTPRSILRNARRDSDRGPVSHLPTPGATPRAPTSALHEPDSSLGAMGVSTSAVARDTPQPAQRPRPDPGLFSASGTSAPLQAQTPLAHPQPSRPSIQFSPILRAYGSPPQSPEGFIEDGSSPPIHVRYGRMDPFWILAPEAATAVRFTVFGHHFWSVSQGLAWAKAYRYMYSPEETTHEDRALSRARQQEILNLSPFDDNFVPETLRLYQETPDTPSWAMYEMACADIVTRAKIAGPDAEVRDLLLHGTEDRPIFWDVNSMTWGRGREKPDGQNAYGIFLMNIREALRSRPGSPLVDTRIPLMDVLYGLR